jgi:hypothetical protein
VAAPQLITINSKGETTMDPHQIKAWIDVFQGLITVAATLIGGFWVWTKFVLERGLLPPSQMEIALRTLGSSESATLVELAVHIHNKGSSALIVNDLRLRLRYLNQDDEIGVIEDPEKSAYGRVNFPHEYVLNRIGADRRDVKPRGKEDIQSGAKEEAKQEVKPAVKDDVPQLARGEFLIVPYDTFVQPGVIQIYSFVTALPRISSYLLARASFRYQLRPSTMQLQILKVSRKLGMLQYSLHHVNVPHTIEKSFRVHNGDDQASIGEQGRTGA